MNVFFERYIVLLEQRHRDVKTIRANVQALRHLDNYFVTYGIDPALATSEALVTFFDGQQSQYAWNTVNGHLKVIRGCYAWHLRNERIKRDPTQGGTASHAGSDRA